MNISRGLEPRDVDVDTEEYFVWWLHNTAKYRKEEEEDEEDL